MYKKKEEKLTIAKINQTCNDMKQDLIESISYENSRANVDNAKKRAVAQHMDYDNFRQMVLGANIKPMKTADLADFLNNQNARTVINFEASIAGVKKDGEKTEEEELAQKIKQLAVASGIQNDFQIPANFREFRKAFELCLGERGEKQEKSDTIKAQRDALEYMKQIPVDKYPKIFSVEFDAQYLIKMVNIFSAILSDKEANDEDLEFMLRFLKNLTSISGFSFNVLGFLSKSEKQNIAGFIQTLDENANEKFSEEKKGEISQIVADIKKAYK